MIDRSFKIAVKNWTSRTWDADAGYVQMEHGRIDRWPPGMFVPAYEPGAPASDHNRAEWLFVSSGAGVAGTMTLGEGSTDAITMWFSNPVVGGNTFRASAPPGIRLSWGDPGGSHASILLEVHPEPELASPQAVELHVSQSSFTTVVERVVQHDLRARCLPHDWLAVDHVDVVPGQVRLAQEGARVEVRVPVKVFLVENHELEAAPNGVPAGAGEPAGRATLVLHLTMATPTTARLRVEDVEFDPADQRLWEHRHLISAGLQAADALELDLPLWPLLHPLGLQSSERSRVQLTGNSVAFALQHEEPVHERLHPGQEWGLHLGRDSVVALLLALIPNVAQAVPMVTSWRTRGHWRPQGDVPVVDVEFEGAAQVPDPFSGRFRGVFHCRLERPGPLRIAVSWELHVDTGAFSPALLDQLARVIASSFIDMSSHGFTVTGPRSFHRDLPLFDYEFGPRVRGLATRLRVSGLAASAAGMTMTGPVRPLDHPGFETVGLRVTGFGRPYAVLFASDFGCVPGFGGREPSAEDLRVSASLGLGSAGTLCGWEPVGDGTAWRNHVIIEEGTEEDIRFVLELPAAVAARTITDNARLVVRTSRGTRLLDLGRPRNGKDAEITYVDDCLWADGPVTALLEWQEWQALYGDHPELWWLYPPPPFPMPDNPLKDPDPLLTHEGIYTKLVHVEGWHPGELVRCVIGRTVLDAVVGPEGRLDLPIEGLLLERQPGVIWRGGREPLHGVTVRTATFRRFATLPTGPDFRVVRADSGRLRIAGEVSGRLEAFEVDPEVGVRQLDEADWSGAAATTPSADRSVDVDLPGLDYVDEVPGFADEPVAFAVLRDGTQMLLDLSAPNGPRVAGRYNGAFPRVAVLDDWGFQAGPRGLEVYRVGGTR